MNVARLLVAVVFTSSLLVACADDTSGPSLDADTDAGSDTGAEDTDTDGGSNNGLTDAAADTTSTDDDADGPDTGSDAGSGHREELPFRGELTFSEDTIPKALLPFELAQEGILVAEVYDASIEIDDVRVKLCDSEGNGCVGLGSFYQPPRSYVPHRLWTDVEAGDYTLEFSVLSLDPAEAPHTLDIGVEFLTVDSVTDPAESFSEARSLESPSATAVRVTEHVPAWFVLDAERPGYLSIEPSLGEPAFVCDMSAWAVNPAGCLSETREMEREIDRAGPVYMLSEASYDTTLDFIVFFDEDPNALVCPAGEHPAGDGSCAPEGTCAVGYHDGGWGECVAEGTCSPRFELRADGRCEGWVEAGALDSFDEISDALVAGPGGTIIVSGRRNDANGDGVYAPQVWDPESKTWSVSDATLSTSGTRRFCPLSDGRVLTMRYGGWVSNGPTDSERIFDPATGTWATPQNMPGVSWTRPSCVMLDNGNTLVFESGIALVFDPVLETWTPAGSPSGHDHEAVEVSPGVVYSAFHSGTSDPRTRHLSKWDSTDNSWTGSPDWPLSDELDDDIGHLVAVAGNPVLFHHDGRVLRLDTDTDTWDTLAPIDLEPFRESVKGAAAVGNKVLFHLYPGRAGVYDVATEQWRELPKPIRTGVPMISQGEYLLIGEYPQRLVVGE